MEFKKDYNSATEFGFHVRLVRQSVVGKNLSDMFLVRNVLKEGDGLSLLLSNFTSEYIIRRDQVNQDCLKLNGVYQILPYVDVKILGGSVHTKKEFTESLIVASKEFGPDVNADKSKYMDMYRD